ncbi:MAG: M14 family metallopeptidase [Candidatus Adlerbacteria bacterium]|nr:M14 family metallopeptidase [Candidatus Adlerbacteria bacterium]
MNRRAVLTLLAIAVLLGVGSFAFVFYLAKPPAAPGPTASVPQTEIVGASVLGRAITAYTYGDGPQHLLFVGGMHGGYEWNSVLLAYQFMDYAKANPDIIPDNVTVTVIPSLNPDGVFKVVGNEGRFSPADASTNAVTLASGRFNANHIDLNRNFDCKWQPNSTWRSEVVGAGSAPFSEPEAKALRTFVLKYLPDAVIFWHSQANAVYASECEEGILQGTRAIMNAYATASGYPAVDSFDAYEITGDAEGWLASVHIPAITVELSTHESVEWEQNLAGVMALFDLYKR